MVKMFCRFTSSGRAKAASRAHVTSISTGAMNPAISVMSMISSSSALALGLNHFSGTSRIISSNANRMMIRLRITSLMLNVVMAQMRWNRSLRSP